ncbi:hypothetical protein PR048_001538, partial [Dryococelus australis]
MTHSLPAQCIKLTETVAIGRFVCLMNNLLNNLNSKSMNNPNPQRKPFSVTNIYCIRLQHDPLENIFSVIYQRCGNGSNPSTQQFRRICLTKCLSDCHFLLPQPT